MSTLVAQTISNGTVSTSTANVINGAKAWVNFNGTGTVAIRASYNVSSITDNGTGDYTVNFTTAMPDANYAVSSINKGDVDRSQIGGPRDGTTTSYQTTTFVRITNTDTRTDSWVFQDSAILTVAIFR
jgi:hypothetical protein